jgi:hypothetical protein
MEVCCWRGKVGLEARMRTEIEDFLFREEAAYWVVRFALAERRLSITVVASDNRGGTFGPMVQAEFEDVRITGIDCGYADEFDLPWDIIGFDCARVSGERWEFCMHTDAGEWVFEAGWPRLLEDGSGRGAAAGTA